MPLNEKILQADLERILESGFKSIIEKQYSLEIDSKNISDISKKMSDITGNEAKKMAADISSSIKKFILTATIGTPNGPGSII